MITDDERFIEIQAILSLSDIHPVDCATINDLIIELSKERNQFKEYTNYNYDKAKQLQQENEQLKDNWDKLKKWLKKELGDRINPNKDKWLTGVYDAYRETIDKMQEIEGSDSNE